MTQLKRIQQISLSISRTLLQQTCPVIMIIHSRLKHLISINNYSKSVRIAMAYGNDHRGAYNSMDYRIYFHDDNGMAVSPWHDIPMLADKSKRIYNMIVEIPRLTKEKMEIATKEGLNPIKHDVQNGQLRYVSHEYIWNYGAIPQTWEDPKNRDDATGCTGDNDPIDICEIGSRVAERGEVIKVKILGVMALIDKGETDWKIIGIDVNDPCADQLNDIGDVEMSMPGLVKATHQWFKIYKMPDGKPKNKFAFNGEAKNREFAEKIIGETHKHWKHLISAPNNESGLNLKNSTLENHYKIDGDTEGRAIINQTPDSNTL